MNRRLPIYFLIDVSESMVGEPIQQVEEGIATIVRELRTDPYALETVYISIIVFAGEAMTLVPLTEIINFYYPKFPIGGGTSFGNGLGQLTYELRKNIIKTTAEQKGDWKPIVFLFTDGVPTDEPAEAICKLKLNWQDKIHFVAVSFGESNNLSLLSELTKNVLFFKNTNVQSYKEFFLWVTASIKSSSLSIGSNGSGFELSHPNDEVISKINLSKTSVKQNFIDTNFAVFLARCQNTKRPYLIKYKRSTTQTDFSKELNMETMFYRFTGAYPVDNSYFELAGGINLNHKISTGELEGFPMCPCCGNQYGFSICSCSKLHCSGNEKVSICPWCGNQGEYGVGNEFNINRTQG